MQVRTAQAPSTTAASSSSAVISPKISTRTSLAFENLASQMSLVWRTSACRSIFCRTVCTAATRYRTKDLSRAQASSSSLLQCTSLSPRRTLANRSDSYRTSSATSCVTTATNHSSRTRIFQRNSAFPSRDYHPPARSVHRVRDRLRSNSKLRRRSENLKKVKRRPRRSSRCSSSHQSQNLKRMKIRRKDLRCTELHLARKASMTRSPQATTTTG